MLDCACAKTFKGDHSFNFSALKPLLGWKRYTNIGANMFRNFQIIPWNKADFIENGLSLHITGTPISKRLNQLLRLNMVRFLKNFLKYFLVNALF